MNKKNIEDIFPLTPSQEAFLIHALRRDVEDQGFLQLQCLMSGALDPDHFDAAWKTVVQRHPMLRASVHWRDLEKPVQVVHKSVAVEVQHLDWRSFAKDEEVELLERLLQDDRRLGLDFGSAPVQRLYLISLAGKRWRLLWSCHHLLLDGWSGSNVVGEVLAVCRSLASGKRLQLAAAPPFRDYATWLRERELDGACQFWRQMLAGAQPGQLLNNSGGRGRYLYASKIIGSQATARLNDFARRHHLTLNSLMQCAWAWVLGQLTDRRDVVFGVSTSGRSVPLTNVEHMVGLMANALPLRIRQEDGVNVGDWLSGVKAQLLAMQSWEWVPLAQVQKWHGSTSRLFDSLLIFENQPWLGEDQPDDLDLKVEEFNSGLSSSFSCTLVAVPGRKLVLHAIVEEMLLAGDNGPGDLLADVADVLEALVEKVDRQLDCLPLPTSQLAKSSKKASVAVGQGARDHLEGVVAGLWAEVLQVERVDIRANFFAMGGDSLAAALLADRCGQYLGRKIAPGAVAQAPTVEGMAELLRTDVEAQWPCWVPIRSGGERSPLYLVHGLPGVAYGYHKLARYLDDRQPVHGLQARPESFDDVGAMAAHYLAEVRAHQPLGPYVLGGFCFGGVVAFEMARALRAAGQEVGLLLIIDSMPPVGFARDWRYYMGQLRLRGPKVLLQRAAHKGRLYFERFRRHLDAGDAGDVSGIDDVIDMEQYPQAYRALARKHFRAASNYLPTVYPGRIHLLRTASQFALRDSSLGWGCWAEQGVQVEVVQGTHHSLLQEPNIANLGQVLNGCLEAYFTPQVQQSAMA